MKTLKTSLAIGLIGLLAAGASADVSRDQLDQISRSESGWTQDNLQIQNYEGSTQVDVTSRGTLRVRRIADSFQATGEIDMPKKLRLNSALLNTWCETHRESFELLKADKNPYVLRVHAYPFATGTVMSTGGLSSVAISTIENFPVLGAVRPHLDLNSSSISRNETQIRTADFERVVFNQLEAQKKSVMATGDAVLDLTGWDDVACDLAEGNATLSFASTISYEAARVTRTSVISGGELQAIYQGLKPMWKPQSGVVRATIVGGALLGASIVSTLRKSPVDYSVDALVCMYTQIFDAASGSLKAQDNSDFGAMASNLDVLSRGANTATPVVREQVTIKNR